MIGKFIAPERFPFFYGWVIVAVSTLGIVGSIPGQTMGVSVFTPRLEAALGLTSSQLSLAYGIGTLTSGLLLVRGGRLIDRFGVRKSMTLSSVCLGASLLLLSVCDRVTGGVRTVLGGVETILIPMLVAIVGFFLIRFLGQGLMAMISRVMIGKWFHRRRGLAVGTSGVLAAFGFGYAPIFLHDLIQAFGWRGAYWSLAGAVGLGMTLIAIVFYREQPSDHGLYTDGDPAPEPEEPGTTPKPRWRDFTLEEARRNYEFWVFTIGLGAQGMIITAVTFHIISLGAESGLSEDVVVSIFLPISIISVASNLTGGWISDRTKLKYLLCVEMAMLILATVSLSALGEIWGRVLVTVGFGVSGGLFGNLVGTTWPRFFGLQHLGAISGQNMSIMVLMTAAGPLLFAESLARLGSYTPGIVVAAVLPAAVFLAALPSGNPQDRLTL